MSEMKCKRCGANENRIHGFCSMECETAWYYEDDIRDLTARIAELEEKQRWIPVSERLPEENQQILSTDGKEFYLDYYARWEGKDNPPCFCDGLSWAVTHWMPLPESPNDTQTQTIVYGKEREE